MLKFQSVSNLEKKVSVGFFFFFKLQGSYLVKVRIPEGGEKPK